MALPGNLGSIITRGNQAQNLADIYAKRSAAISGAPVDPNALAGVGYRQNEYVKGYDPSTVTDFEREKNAAIVKALHHQYGNRAVYDPTTGRVYDARKGVWGLQDASGIINRAQKNFYQQSIRKQALDNYNKFNPDEYVKGESDVYRRNLAQQVVQQQKQVQAEQNARGMLNSGRTQKRSAEVTQAANEDFAQKRNELVQNALKQKQALGADPLMGMANQSIANLQSKYDQLSGSSGTDHSQDYAAIGSGIGQIAANNSSSSKTTTGPKSQITTR